VARLTTAVDYVPRPEEVVDLFEVPVADLLEERRWSVRPNRRPSAEVRRVPFFDWQGRIVWGLTAIILRDFLRAVIGQAPLGPERDPATADDEPHVRP
jgi:hypothetical protein